MLLLLSLLALAQEVDPIGEESGQPEQAAPDIVHDLLDHIWTVLLLGGGSATVGGGGGWLLHRWREERRPTEPTEVVVASLDAETAAQIAAMAELTAAIRGAQGELRGAQAEIGAQIAELHKLLTVEDPTTGARVPRMARLMQEDLKATKELSAMVRELSRRLERE